MVNHVLGLLQAPTVVLDPLPVAPFIYIISHIKNTDFPVGNDVTVRRQL